MQHFVITRLQHLVFALFTVFICTKALADDYLTHPWNTPLFSFEKSARFTNIKNGDVIETPYLIKFGLTGIGIAAIDKPLAQTGHHHLLIDRPLPSDFRQPLPFNDQYIHFGKGQMETVINLPPGEHTIRLVFADHRHIPNFVYSAPVKITVSQQNKQLDPQSLLQKKVEILEPVNGSKLSAPFRISMHASGWKISHEAINNPETGHFQLIITPRNGKEQVLDFHDGRTEVWLTPPPGEYVAVVNLISNQNGSVLASSIKSSFTITAR
ncbi:DUF4399 domain-containing protein [Ampullimonas aquatilis]|uniref:DUF4399 domain-containing protein n=1 Tax=Ampullimonas aquatilis TaxID=1341549 RepID=UPI003C77A823